jgi:hypothetical protein
MNKKEKMVEAIVDAAFQLKKSIGVEIVHSAIVEATDAEVVDAFEAAATIIMGVEPQDFIDMGIEKSDEQERVAIEYFEGTKVSQFGFDHTSSSFYNALGLDADGPEHELLYNIGLEGKAKYSARVGGDVVEAMRLTMRDYGAEMSTLTRSMHTYVLIGSWVEYLLHRLETLEAHQCESCKTYDECTLESKRPRRDIEVMGGGRDLDELLRTIMMIDPTASHGGNKPYLN